VGQNVSVVADVADALGASTEARTGGLVVTPCSNASTLLSAALALNASALGRPREMDNLLSSLLQVSTAAAGG
jgi:hypothetical protein